MAHPSDIGTLYLESVRDRFQTMKQVGERAMEQVNDADLDWQANPEANSIRLIVQHLRGNMLSRWTDTLTTDGEKPDRHRDAEFVVDGPADRDALRQTWEEGWDCLLDALVSFNVQDLEKTIYIRGEAHSLLDAINRQLIHCSYHVGQIVQLAKERVGERWQTLSIPRGKSASYRPGDPNAWSPSK